MIYRWCLIFLCKNYVINYVIILPGVFGGMAASFYRNCSFGDAIPAIDLFPARILAREINFPHATRYSYHYLRLMPLNIHNIILQIENYSGKRTIAISLQITQANV